MHIHQCIDARAVLTLGKDTTSRDYAQGAFRMRGIGKGQTIELFVIPEVMRLVNDQQLSQAPQTPAPQSQGGGLLSLAFNAGQASHGSGKQFLINVAG